MHLVPLELLTFFFKGVGGKNGLFFFFFIILLFNLIATEHQELLDHLSI